MKNQDILAGSSSAGVGAGRNEIDGSIENLPISAKLAKCQKPKLTMTKKSDFAEANFFGTDFLIFKAKKASST